MVDSNKLSARRDKPWMKQRTEPCLKIGYTLVPISSGSEAISIPDKSIVSIITSKAMIVDCADTKRIVSIEAVGCHRDKIGGRLLITIADSDRTKSAYVSFDMFALAMANIVNRSINGNYDLQSIMTSDFDDPFDDYNSSQAKVEVVAKEPTVVKTTKKRFAHLKE